MAGASERTQRVVYVNANWAAAGPGEDGRFELLIVTEDEQRHTVQPSASALAGLVALTQASTVMLWDPEVQTLIVGNLVGQWIPESWSAQDTPPSD